jgi:serine/threonine protein kinase
MGAADQLTFGKYQLLEQISAGGMGVVYRARHTMLGHEAAIKILPLSLAADPNARQFFSRGAASAAGLNHPNILPTLEYGEDEGHLYLVMPLIRGGTLRERMLRGPIAPARIVGYLRQLAAALDFAHAHRIVHRDVKPQNILIEVIDGEEHLFLADFGIAKALEGTIGLTRTGASVGTPEYMAPEQARGQADPRSDLYALGIILYQLLTGVVPYSGTTPVEVLMKHLHDPLPQEALRRVSPPLPDGVIGVLQRALAKAPDERYQSGQALVEGFVAALARRDMNELIGVTAVPELDVTELAPQLHMRTPMPLPISPTPVPGFPTAATRVSLPAPTPPPMLTPQANVAVPSLAARRSPLVIGLAAALVVALVGCLGVGGVGAYMLRPTPAPANRQVALIDPTAIPTATPIPPTATALPPSPTPIPPSPSPSASPRPSPSPSPTLTGPVGKQPAGWSIYAGSERLPFAIYYPTGWMIDSTTDPRGISFRAPDNRTTLFVGVMPASDEMNINGLRDDFKRDMNFGCIRDGDCVVTDGYTGNDAIGGIGRTTFAWQTLTITYRNGATEGMRAGEGLKNGNYWHYEFVSPGDSFNASMQTYMLPMLNSLNIYATPTER